MVLATCAYRGLRSHTIFFYFLVNFKDPHAIHVKDLKEGGICESQAGKGPFSGLGPAKNFS